MSCVNVEQQRIFFSRLKQQYKTRGRVCVGGAVWGGGEGVCFWLFWVKRHHVPARVHVDPPLRCPLSQSRQSRAGPQRSGPSDPDRRRRAELVTRRDIWGFGSSRRSELF